VAAGPTRGLGPNGLEANGALVGAHVARRVPADWTEEQRRELLLIAARAKAELCASFGLVALGVQAFCFNSNGPAAPAVAPGD